MRVLLISHDLSDNSMGRTWVLWEALRRAGLSVYPVGRATGGFWRPLAGTEFEEASVRLPSRAPAKVLRRYLRPNDLLYAVKARPGSLGVAVSARDGHHVALDIDEDDYAGLLGRDTNWLRRPRGFLSVIRRRESPLKFRHLQHRVPHFALSVSNPTLIDRFGAGRLVPHARDPMESGISCPSNRPMTIAFVGTARFHKGIDVLRAGVEKFGRDGRARLIVTDTRPADASPWESWVGQTSMEQGRAIVRDADVVAITSRPTGFAATQLPVKLIDAMMAGRAIIASDTPPIRWALGGSGALVPPGSVEALHVALGNLLDRQARTRMGASARARAEKRFTFGAVTPALLEVVEDAHRA